MGQILELEAQLVTRRWVRMREMTSLKEVEGVGVRRPKWVRRGVRMGSRLYIIEMER